MVIKIICLIICAVLLFICYRAKFFAERVLRLENVTDKQIMNIKLVVLVLAIILFITVFIFFR